MGEVTIDKFGPMQMELLVNALSDHGGQKTERYPQGRPLSPKTVRHIAFLVHGCFEKAVKWEFIPRNPMHDVELPKVAKKPPQAIEKGGVGKLLRHARDTRLYPFILLGLATGARRGELLAIQWDDVDFVSGLLNITKSLEQTKAGLRIKPTKSEKPRRFAVPVTALDALKKHHLQQDGDRAMFGADYQETGSCFADRREPITAPYRLVAG
jgi:integrase